MRTYPFNIAPLMITLTLLLNTLFPVIKVPSPPKPPPALAAVENSR